MTNTSRDIALQILAIFPLHSAIIVSLQYPKSFKPSIGGYLYTAEDVQIKLSGCVWGTHHPDEDVWDCKLEGELGKLKVGDVLYLRILN